MQGLQCEMYIFSLNKHGHAKAGNGHAKAGNVLDNVLGSRDRQHHGDTGIEVNSGLIICKGVRVGRVIYFFEYAQARKGWQCFRQSYMYLK